MQLRLRHSNYDTQIHRLNSKISDHIEKLWNLYYIR